MKRIHRSSLVSSDITLVDWATTGFSNLCPKCGAKNAREPRKAGCSLCGAVLRPLLLCPSCEGVLADQSVEYESIRDDDVCVIKTFAVMQCSTCRHFYIDPTLLHDLDTFIATVPEGFRILPEVGISTSRFLEVFVSGGNDFEDPKIIRRRASGLELRFGPQTQLFSDSLQYITDRDIGDYGHDLSPTMRVRPGPPYSIKQRRTLHLLLLRLRLRLGTPLHFWTVRLREPFEDDEEENRRTLLEAVEKWPYDRTREALALANAVCNNDYPGVFINTFRLLELVLDRLIDRDIQRMRWQQGTSDSDFLLIAKAYTVDLRTKLRKRVDALPVFPENLLRDIWRVLRVEKGFNPKEIFVELVKFRNLFVHAPFREDDLVLPWEVPDFDSLSHHLVRLITVLVSEGESEDTHQFRANR